MEGSNVTDLIVKKKTHEKWILHRLCEIVFFFFDESEEIERSKQA